MAVGEPASKAAIGDLLSRLRDMARAKETIDVAQLHFVGLEKIKRAYGDRWLDHKSRIQDAAESFLRKRIGQGDVLVRGDGGFLIVLADAMGPKAHAVTAELTHGLNAFFTGDLRESPTPRFGGAVQNIATRDLERSLRQGAAPVEPAENLAERSGGSDLEWKFEPVWDVRKEALSYWFVTPCISSTGLRVPGYQFETAAGHTQQFVRIDEAGLWVAEQALLDLARVGRQALVGATVHAQSMTSDASRARILATIDRLNPSLHRFRIIKIAGVSQGFPRLYLKEIIGALRSRVPNVTLLAQWDEPDIASLLHPGLSGLGFVAPGSGIMTGTVTSIPALMLRVSEAMKLAHAARMRFFVEGAVTKYLALKFATAGVDNIASPSIWAVRGSPEGMLKWSADRLVA